MGLLLLLLIVWVTIAIYIASIITLISMALYLELSLIHSWLICVIFTLMFIVITIMLDKIFFAEEPDQKQKKKGGK